MIYESNTFYSYFRLIDELLFHISYKSESGERGLVRPLVDRGWVHPPTSK